MRAFIMDNLMNTEGTESSIHFAEQCRGIGGGLSSLCLSIGLPIRAAAYSRKFNVSLGGIVIVHHDDHVRHQQ